MQDRLTAIANDTLKIAKEGIYTSAEGHVIDLGDSVAQSVKHTRLIGPSRWDWIMERAEDQKPFEDAPEVSITDETTLEATRRLSKGGQDVMALNFASARNPGGGFLRGTFAQEESLARSSALYCSLISKPDFYTKNKDCKNTLYTDHAIYSHKVPVFRDDYGYLLNNFYLSSFITMPAPNRNKGKTTELQANAAIGRRTHQVLALSVFEEQENIVLGAWGCGVFRNNPDSVARSFSIALRRWKQYFRRITFAICGGGKSRSCFESGLSEHL